MLGAVGLQVEQRIAARKPGAAQQREARVGIDERHFKGIVRRVVHVVQRNIGQGKTQVAVVLPHHKQLVQPRLGGGGFGQQRGAIGKRDRAGGGPAAIARELGVGERGVGGDVVLDL